jgi:hypothetical protein
MWVLNSVLWYYAMRRRVVLEIVTYILEDNIASIFRVGTLIREAALSHFSCPSVQFMREERNFLKLCVDVSSLSSAFNAEINKLLAHNVFGIFKLGLWI